MTVADPTPKHPPRRATANALLVATTAAGSAASFLALLLLAPPLLHLAAAEPAVCTAAAAVLAAGLAVGYVRLPWAPVRVDTGPAAGVRAGAEALVVAAGASVISHVAGGGLVPLSGAMEEGTTLLILYVLAVLGAFAGAVLLLLVLSDTSPTPVTAVSRSAVQALKLAAVMLMVLNLLYNLLLVFG